MNDAEDRIQFKDMACFDDEEILGAIVGMYRESEEAAMNYCWEDRRKKLAIESTAAGAVSDGNDAVQYQEFDSDDEPEIKDYEWWVPEKRRKILLQIVPKNDPNYEHTYKRNKYNLRKRWLPPLTNLLSYSVECPTGVYLGFFDGSATKRNNNEGSCGGGFVLDGKLAGFFVWYLGSGIKSSTAEVIGLLKLVTYAIKWNYLPLIIRGDFEAAFVFFAKEDERERARQDKGMQQDDGSKDPTFGRVLAIVRKLLKNLKEQGHKCGIHVCTANRRIDDSDLYKFRPVYQAMYINRKRNDLADTCAYFARKTRQRYAVKGRDITRMLEVSWGRNEEVAGEYSSDDISWSVA